MRSSRAPARARRTLTVLAAVALATTIAGSAAAAPGGQGKAGFKTSVPAMLMPGADAPAGVEIEPLISVGDEIRGFVFDAIPDGIAFTRSGNGRADLYVNHETSLVPFPGNLTDFSNSHVDRLVINQHSGGILAGSDAIPARPTTSASARATSPPRPRASTARSCSPTRKRPTSSTGPASPGRPR